MMVMEVTTSTWVAWVVGVLPLVGWLLWWWNDLWYGLPVKIRCSSGGAKLPPGHMGVPFFGELLIFLWYFKVIRRPDDFINSKRRKYGDGEGMYRTHLFGSPAIIACFPAINKFIFQSDSQFHREWPTVKVLGTTSLVCVQGEEHMRLRGFLSRGINQTDALRRVARMVQPRIIASLQSWTHKGRITAYNEVKKVTFENIGKFFASLEPGPVLDNLEELLRGIILGVRAYPINFPGTAYYHGLQCQKKAVAIFREKLEERKENQDGANTLNDDLMDGLMHMKDDEGKQLRDVEVLDNIVSFIVGGYESTTLAIMWALYYLAKYPNCLQKLREENMALSKNKNGEPITSDEFLKLKYTNMVVEETIRLSNIASFIFRTATKDIEFKGYKIPKGWKVILWLRYLHTSPENFEDPMCFNPDRWNEPTKPGAYLVFGGGSRLCAGNMLARLQLAIFLHHLAIGYKWELVNPTARMNYLPHLKPEDGVEIVFSKL